MTLVETVSNMFAERDPQLLIGGEWTAATSGEVKESIDPSTGRPWANYAVANAADVERAVKAAQEAQPAWARIGVEGRSTAIDEFRRLVEENAHTLAMADAIDAGLPIDRMIEDVRRAIEAMRKWAGIARAARGESMPADDVLHYTRLQPYGVVAKIIAYNHPALFALKGTMAALLSGNAVVLKPAEQTPASALLIGDLARQALPPGVFSVVTGGREAGDALVTHPHIRRIAFTGSVQTGQLIQQRAASSGIKTVTLELGGKNPMIVCADVDVERAVREVIKAMNLRANQGQSCGSTSRLFVHKDVFDAFREALAVRLEGLTLGSAYEPTSDMGPMISAQHAAAVKGFIQRAIYEGAEVVTGGLKDPRAVNSEFFVAPTLLENVAPTSDIAQNEVFGPVMTIIPWSDETELLEMVNSVEYGLTASIWTRDLETALRLVDEIECGYIWVNDSTTHYWGTPFGGWKNSGIGREESMDEFYSYLQTKAVHIKFRE